MAISSMAALWFLPFVLPICLYVAYTDLRDMRISNKAVLLLAGVFIVLGPFLMPLSDYGMRLVQLLGVLVAGMVLNFAGAVGAGDAKFAAAAAPFIAPQDLSTVIWILAAALVSAVVTHRLAKYSPLRRVVPHWQSWDRGLDFPMGLALGPALGLYLFLGALYGV